jgi:hypothetical protein
MTTYFEIGGHIVECHEILTSPELKSFGTEVSSIAMGISEGYKSAAPSSKGVSEKDSLLTHWVKVSSLGVRKMGPDVLIGGPWTNPRGFTLKGIGITLKAIEMNYDYFVKGESHDW